MRPPSFLSWQAPHRPLFLLAALAAFATPWIWLFPGWFEADPVRLHFHELTFGMAGAAVGGYLLTALPNWTKRRAASSWMIAALVLLWITARVTFTLGEHLSPPLKVAGTCAYFALLAAYVAWRTVRARAWQKTGPVAVTSAIAIGDALFLLGDADAHGMLSVVALFSLLISVVGGRAVPAFTRSWLEQNGVRRNVRDRPALSAVATGSLVLGCAAVFSGHPAPAGLLLLSSSLMQAVRTGGWASFHILRYPALLMLHLAWFWLPVGTALLGLALLTPERLAPATAVHALTMGAMGTMILAIMGRAAMARRGLELVAGYRLVLAFALLWLAALFRIAPLTDAGSDGRIIAAAALWIAGWSLFLWAYMGALRRPAPYPVLSALRGERE